MLHSLTSLLLLVPLSASLLAQFRIDPEPVAEGLDLPVDIVNAGDGTNRLFVVELSGKIRVVQGGQLLPEAFLDLTGSIIINVNLGLSGLVFHPRFAENGRFFVHYGRSLSETEYEDVISEFRVSPEDPNRALGEERVILRISRPTPNHPGGDLAFGPDGFLYISSGDTGVPGDPAGTAQDPGSLLGKILRIDVDGAEPYQVPDSNPFVNQEGFRPEIWALGFRHPYRMSFDAPSGRLFAGDVGASRREEINLISRGGNYGWNIREGTLCFPSSNPACPLQDAVDPIFELDRSNRSAAIIGGVVYRGSQLQTAWGNYIFAEFEEPSLWSLEQVGPQTWIPRRLLRPDFKPACFGVDEEGEIFTAGLYNGELYRLRFHWSTDLPLYVSGEIPGRLSYRSTLIASNPAPQDSHVVVQLHDTIGDPSPLDLPGAEEDRLEFTLQGLRSMSLRSQRQDGPRAGRLEILSDHPLEVSIQLELESVALGSTTASLTSASPARHQVGNFEIGPQAARSTALVLINPSLEEGREIEITVLLRDSDGSLRGTRLTRLQPGRSEAFFLDEVTALRGLSGTLELRADDDFLAAAILTESGLPVAPIPLATR